MPRNVSLYLAAEVAPGDVAALAGDGLEVHTSGRLAAGTPGIDEAAAVLGTMPLTRVRVELLRARGYEWRLAEFVLAAAQRWTLVVRDAAERVVSVAEFERRLAGRHSDFFVPDDWLSPDPSTRREASSTTVDVLFPASFDEAAALDVARSLGARIRPDDVTEAELSRSGRYVWLYLREARLQTDVYKVAEYRSALGEPPYRSVRMQVLEGSAELAVAFVEALGARTALLVQGPWGQLMTLGDLRLRVSNGAHDPFCP
ncbi:hypothetical protein [Actinocorallia longicatena]|uniref:Uncharacterized protein n=1 Tax=Actinocorallia longicatena TaxID=111803 RepID=A0ABP6Q157_9ACTN